MRLTWDPCRECVTCDILNIELVFEKCSHPLPFQLWWHVSTSTTKLCFPSLWLDGSSQIALRILCSYCASALFDITLWVTRFSSPRRPDNWINLSFPISVEREHNQLSVLCKTNGPLDLFVLATRPSTWPFLFVLLCSSRSWQLQHVVCGIDKT